MTENEAIEKLKSINLYMKITDKESDCKFSKDDYLAIKEAIKALEEVYEYRKLGTVEEVGEAVGKTKKKKVKIIGGRYRRCSCPTCGNVIGWNFSPMNCIFCGQRLESEE